MKSKLLALVTCFFALAATAQQKAQYTDADAGQHVGEEATVVGKVANVSTSSRGTIYLNFGDRYPRQTFNGVIFASNREAVGDVKQYEGKEVTLSGKIETAPDGKPQIIIRKPDQIQIAGVTPPPSMPVPASTPPASSSPATPPMTLPPGATAPPAETTIVTKGRLNLAMNWTSPVQGGEMVRKDLAKLFALYGTASDSPEVDASMMVYENIRFLTPLIEARKALRLQSVASVKTRVMTPGMPQGSLSAHAFTGVFAGGFTRIYLVTDNSDQVVSVLLEDANTRTRVNNEPDTTGYHAYNFITGGVNGSSDFEVRHKPVVDETMPGVVVVDTLFIDPTDPETPEPKRYSKSKASYTRQKTGKVLLRTRWFVPVPLVNLILRSVR